MYHRIVINYGYSHHFSLDCFVCYNYKNDFSTVIKMCTTFEQLPVELWISIFSYLEAHELLQAFSNLNHHINQILTSNYLVFHVRLGKTNHNPLDYSTQSYWSDSILNRIVSLQPIDSHKTSHIPEFLRWHCTKLIQLKFLKVKLRGREIPAICYVLPQLPSLEYLSIDCVPNQMLLDAVLSTSSIRICHVNFLRVLTSINSKSKIMSNIERFSITLRDDEQNSLMNLLLSHMPKLQRLEIHSPEIYFDNRQSPFAKPTFLLPQLQRIKINWSLMYCDPNFFENLHKIMPNLHYFHLNINYNYLTEDFFENLICHWWSIIEQISHVNLSINCQRTQMTIDNNTQTNVDRFQSILLAMNEKYQRSLKVNWFEKIFIGYEIITISICKS
ncbi:hypothetical protein I4U23_001376 [Adineta vaga]|nr:hypothetical protein I4U23_001376 [Adineta vaga]